MNFLKYSPYPQVSLAKRTWPDNRIVKAPVWCSVDLRDGNQALPEPMSVDEKITFFKLLLEIGFKEIELGFPAASAIEFNFVRTIIENNLIPDDVTVQVLAQTRPEIIDRTLESVKGAEKVIINIYNPVSPLQRDVVLRKNKNEVIRAAVDSIKHIKNYKEKYKSGMLKVEYCPESFMAAEPEFVVDVCNAVINEWGPNPEEKMIINLAASMEISVPNIFADNVELFCSKVDNRESLEISIHTHNDRGTAVAAAELAVMAGAERVEGCLFGNGERAGNMDIITMALNLFTQGINPCLDISDINKISSVYTKCTKMSIPPRHPYAGELVFTAFSGGHQDAVSKCFKMINKSSSEKWNVPYLPVDPGDIGRSYDSLIRINSQSGKSGAAYIMEDIFGIKIPVWFRPIFGRAVQSLAESWGKELLPSHIIDCFQKEFLEKLVPYRLKKCTFEKGRNNNIKASLSSWDKELFIEGKGDTCIESFIKAFQRGACIKFECINYEVHKVLRKADMLFIAYISIKDISGNIFFGAGIDWSDNIALVKAVISAVNRSINKSSICKKTAVPLPVKDVPLILKDI